MLNEFPPSLTQTEEGLSRGDREESEDGSEIYQAFGLHPEEGSEDATTAGDMYYTRRLYNNDGDNGYKLYNNEERLYIVSENLGGEGEKVPVRSNSYLFQGGDSRTPTGKAGWKNSNGTNGWKSAPPSRQNSVVPSALRREKARKATVLPPLHKVRPASFKSIFTSRALWSRPNQGKTDPTGNPPASQSFAGASPCSGSPCSLLSSSSSDNCSPTLTSTESPLSAKPTSLLSPSPLPLLQIFYPQTKACVHNL